MVGANSRVHRRLEGSYFKREMTKARDEKRLGLPVPYDPSRPVNTFWDVGMNDENCIWFHQTDGVRHRLIDFYRTPARACRRFIQMSASGQSRHFDRIPSTSGLPPNSGHSQQATVAPTPRKRGPPEFGERALECR
jgi:hypothetical protein